MPTLSPARKPATTRFVVGLGVAAVGAGLVLALASRQDALVEARTFALALAAVALVNVALGLAARGRR